jgi:type IV pilus assembly protein PilA
MHMNQRNRRDPARRTGLSRRSLLRNGFSLMELLIVIAILLIIGAVAIPKVGVALMSGREAAALKAVQTINAVQAQYNGQFSRYASSLAELGPPASGQPGPNGADLIGKDLASGIKGGYQFTVQGSPSGYTVNANPVTFGSSGRRTFFSDASGIIRENWGQEPASVNSAEVGSGAGAGAGERK